MKCPRRTARVATYERVFTRTSSLKLLVVVLMCVGLASVSEARSVFDVYGGKGDQQASDQCPLGSYMVGVVGNTGAWIDQITVVCGAAKDDGTVKGSKSLPSRGGTGGAFNSVLCEKNEVVYSIGADRAEGYQILQVALHCRNLKTGELRHLMFGGNGQYEAGGPPQTCPDGEYATGLTINFGVHVNALGLICDTYRPSKVVQPSPPKPDPAPATPDPQEVADRDPNGKTVEQCQEAFARNQQRCEQRFPGANDFAAKAACLQVNAQIVGACVSIASAANPPPPSPGGQTATVLLDVDVYSAPGGNDADKTGVTLNAGTSDVKVLAKRAYWYHVQWPDGDGWVYSGSGYRSLELH